MNYIKKTVVLMSSTLKSRAILNTKFRTVALLVASSRNAKNQRKQSTTQKLSERAIFQPRDLQPFLHEMTPGYVHEYPSFKNDIEVWTRDLEFNAAVGEVVGDHDILELLVEAAENDVDTDAVPTSGSLEEFFAQLVLNPLDQRTSTTSQSQPELSQRSPPLTAGSPPIVKAAKSDIPQRSQKSSPVVAERSPATLQSFGFVSAKAELIQQAIKENRPVPQLPSRQYLHGTGLRKPGTSKFASPLLEEPEKEQKKAEVEVDGMEGIDPQFVERIKNDILLKTSKVSWHDIKGLAFAKETIQETIVYPLLRPDLFTGIRKPSKGILLFGPPGTGKTLIAKCVAANANATFFNISSSSLTSKWIGEGEMMVRALFKYARSQQPSVVFIDEIDALLSRRSDTEHESSRRLKTEFLIFLDGAGTGEDEQILFIGATNRPQELDEAARRRFTKRLYIPLPETEARKEILMHHLGGIDYDITDEEVDELSGETDGFSGADLKSLVHEASLTPMREMLKGIGPEKLLELKQNDIPRLTLNHFRTALKKTRPSVSQDDLKEYLAWDKKFGSGGN